MPFRRWKHAPKPDPTPPRQPTAPSPAPGTWAEEIDALPYPDDVKGSATNRGCLLVVGSGKGGVGKTLVSSSLALGLARADGSPVLAIDVDLGGANLHTALGIRRPVFGLSRFLLDGRSLNDVIQTTNWKGLRFVGGASDILGLAEFDQPARRRLVSELRSRSDEIIILDLGAGSSTFNLELFALADWAVLVTTPEPTAVENAYGFLRAAVFRRIRLLLQAEEGIEQMLGETMNHATPGGPDSLPELVQRAARYNRHVSARLEEILSSYATGLIVNLAGPRRASEIGERLAQVVRRYLGLRLEYLGHIDRDEKVGRSVRDSHPVTETYPRAKASRSLERIVDRLAARLDSPHTIGSLVSR